MSDEGMIKQFARNVLDPIFLGIANIAEMLGFENVYSDAGRQRSKTTEQLKAEEEAKLKMTAGESALEQARKQASFSVMDVFANPLVSLSKAAINAVIPKARVDVVAQNAQARKDVAEKQQKENIQNHIEQNVSININGSNLTQAELEEAVRKGSKSALDSMNQEVWAEVQ
jgi:hypothetical protein